MLEFARVSLFPFTILNSAYRTRVVNGVKWQKSLTWEFCILEDPNFKIFPGSMPPDPPTMLSYLGTSPTQMATFFQQPSTSKHYESQGAYLSSGDNLIR